MNEQPQSQGQEPAPQNVPPAYPPQAPAAATKSKTWIWIVIGAVVLGLVGIAIFFFVALYPGIQARAVATSFMDAVKNDNEAEMIKLSGTGRDGLTQRATAGLKGASYSVSDSIHKDDGYVVNFNVTGSSTIKDTTVVVKSGKVTTFNLNSKGSVPAPNDAGTPAAATTSCLTESDLKKSGITYIDASSLASGAGSKVYLTEFFFKPDSTDYLMTDAAEKETDLVSTLYKNNVGKDFSFTIYGAVHETASSSAGVQLANQRANKVKDLLVAKGVPAAKVTVTEPVSAATSASADSERRIGVDIAIPASCADGGSAASAANR